MNHTVRACLIALLLIGSSCSGTVGASASFKAGFEKGFDADESGGSPKATATGAVQRVVDRFGTSVVLGPGAASLDYSAEGNVSFNRGSLVTWLQPTGWKKESNNDISLLAARKGEAYLTLTWRAVDATLIFTCRQPGGGTRTVRKPAYDWVQSSWHHVVLTWSGQTVELYVDGQSGWTGGLADLKSQIENQDSEILELGGSFPPGATLFVRGVTVSPEPLSKQNVQDLYRVAVSGRVEHERPVMTIAPCKQPPAIDGKLSEGEWDSAAGTSGFVELGNGTLSSVGTQVLIACDEKNVYIACRCPFTPPLTGNKYERDHGTPWDEDCFEAYLQPEVGFTAKSYHIVLNAFGSLFDLDDQNPSWNGVSQWATSRGETAWTGEMAVPFSTLNTLPPNDNTTWQANFCHSVGPSGTTNRNTEWAFTGGSGYAVWQMFGKLIFSRNSAVARVETLTAQPAQGAEVRVSVSNPTAQPMDAQVNILAYRAGNAEETQEQIPAPWSLPAGQSKEDSFKVQARFPIDQVRVQVRSAKTGQVAFSQMVRSGALVPTLVTVATPTATGAASSSTPKLTQEILDKVKSERAVWENNKLGITTKIPPPWTPMKVTSKAITCWGRAYDYASSLFPKAVQSKASEILSAPITLVAKVGGSPVTLQKADKQSMSAAPHQVDVDSTSTTAGVIVGVKSHLEYDGCVKVELTLTPNGGPAALDGLELRIPIKPERALYYHWFEATRDPRLTNAGALPTEGLKSHFKPLLWLGDDDRGFCWFCESPKGWQVNDKESVLRVERQKTATVMRITMMDRPFTLDKPWKIVFGLMATPTRPMPKGWRDWLIPLNQSNPWGSWAPGFNNLSGTDDPGTLTPKDPEAMKKWVAQKHATGDAVPFLPMKEPAKVIPYSQIVFWSGKQRDGMPSPEIKLFGPEWSNTNKPVGPRTEPDEQIPLKEYYWVCPGSSFSQFYLWKLNQLIDQTGIDGIYIDGPWNTCSNKQHGCGYADDKGVWQPEFKIWPFRDLLKRMYCLFYEKRKDPVIHHHTSCWLSIPGISFSHMMLDGEQYHDAGQKVEDHFMDIVPLDKWRAEHTMRQWGPAPFLLPDIPGQWCVPAAPTRELLMLTNLHDTGIFPAGNNTRLVMRNYQARRLFGVADCEFRGYWGNADWVKCETPEVHVSIYRKPDASRCLLVVGNTAKSDAVAAVRPNLLALKLRGGGATAAVDLETGENIPIEKGVIALPVKARDFRLIALPFYAAPPITAGDLAASALKEMPNPGFEKDLAGWSTIPLEGNSGYVTADKETKLSGNASCHLHKADGPGGVMIQSDDVFAVEVGKKYRVNCQVKIANSTGAQAYWMISAMDGEGNSVLSNNLFAGFVKENQDWKPLPFEFPTPAGAAVIRLHFLVAFPGVADVWVDDMKLEEVK